MCCQCVGHRWLGGDKSDWQRRSSPVRRHQLPESPRPVWTAADTTPADPCVPRADHRTAGTGRRTSVQLIRWNRFVVVVVECIYERYGFSYSIATSSAECNCCSPPPAWTVGSCWQYVVSFDTCHKSTCRLLQGSTSFDWMRSGLGWSRSDSRVPSSV